MAIASFNFGRKSNLPATTTTGALYFLTDSGELYYGNGSSGVKISDIEIVATFSDLESITTPLSNKFYYVTADTAIYRYQNNNWIAVSGGGGGSITAGVGLSKSGVTLKAKLLSETALGVASSSGTVAAGKVYSVNVDNAGYLCVAVPWSNTEYQNKTAESGGTDISLVTTGDKYNWDHKTSNTGTVTSVTGATGLTGTVTGSGSIKANLVSETKLTNAATAATEVANRVYPVALDSNGKLAVNVPWVQGSSTSGTVTSVATGAGLTGGTITSSGTLKANLRSETKLTNDSAAATETAGRIYPVVLDKTGYLAVNVPWVQGGSGTVTSVATGAGLTGGTITGSGTLKAYMKSETKATYDSTTITNTSGRQYAVTPDKTGYLSVNVPWEKGTGTVTSVATGAGLTGGTITSSGTLKANLRSETKLVNNSAAATETAGRIYPVALDASGYLAVNVPWVQGSTTTGTVTSVATGAGLTGGTITSSGTLKAYMKSETKATYDSASITNTSGRQYAVTPDKTGYLSVNVPWEKGTYSAGTGLTASGTTFNHASSITQGTASGTSGSLTNGGTFQIPSISYNDTGHITSVSTTTCTLPNIPSFSGSWTSPVAALAGATSVSFTNPKNSASVTVDPYCENTAGTNQGTAPIAISEIKVATSSPYGITLYFDALTASTTFKCLVY